MDPDRLVGDLVGVTIAKGGDEGVVAGGEEATHLLQTPAHSIRIRA